MDLNEFVIKYIKMINDNNNKIRLINNWKKKFKCKDWDRFYKNYIRHKEYNTDTDSDY